MRRHTACSETDANKLITGDNVRKRVNAVTRRIRGVKHKMTGNLNFKNLDSTYRDGDFRKAVFMAQDIVAAHPNNSEAKYKLALALSRDSQLLRAEATLSSIVPDFGSPGQTERRYKRALEVVRAKIVDAGKWVENSAGPPCKKLCTTRRLVKEALQPGFFWRNCSRKIVAREATMSEELPSFQ